MEKVTCLCLCREKLIRWEVELEEAVTVKEELQESIFFYKQWLEWLHVMWNLRSVVARHRTLSISSMKLIVCSQLNKLWETLKMYKANMLALWTVQPNVGRPFVVFPFYYISHYFYRSSLWHPNAASAKSIVHLPNCIHSSKHSCYTCSFQWHLQNMDCLGQRRHSTRCKHYWSVLVINSFVSIRFKFWTLRNTTLQKTLPLSIT